MTISNRFYLIRNGIFIIALLLVTGGTGCRSYQQTGFLGTVYYLRGNFYSTLGDYEHAIIEYTHALELDPDFVDAYRSRGYSYHAIHNYDNAIADYDQTLKLEANDANVYYYRGEIYNSRGYYDRAIADYDKAIELNPSFADAYYSRGCAYFVKFDYDRAIADFDQTINFNPASAWAYYMRGRTRSLTNYDCALADLNKALILKPDLALAYYERGQVYRRLEENSKALADFSKAIALEPGLAQAYYDRGFIHDAMGHCDLAIADFSKAITLKPNLAQVYSRLEEKVEAVADLEKKAASLLNSCFKYSGAAKNYVPSESELPKGFKVSVETMAGSFPIETCESNAYQVMYENMDSDSKGRQVILFELAVCQDVPSAAKLFNNFISDTRWLGEFTRSVVGDMSNLALSVDGPVFVAGFRNADKQFYIHTHISSINDGTPLGEVTTEIFRSKNVVSVVNYFVEDAELPHIPADYYSRLVMEKLQK